MQLKLKQLPAPEQKPTSTIGILPENSRALVFLDDLLTKRKAYIVKRDDTAAPFVFELMVGAQCVAQVLGEKSNHPVFMDAVEMKLAELGYAMTHPTEANHVWLDPTQFAADVPGDWKVFADETSGWLIKRDRFYGFGDSGSMAGGAEGYATREECVAYCKTEWPAEELGTIGTKPEELGTYAVCVLSGEEFVNQLHSLGPEGIWFYGEFRE